MIKKTGSVSKPTKIEHKDKKKKIDNTLKKKDIENEPS